MTNIPMKIEDLHPDFQKPFSRMPNIPFHNAFARAAMQFMMGITNPPVKDPAVRLSMQKLSHEGVRIYEPVADHSGAGLFWIHGGGMIVGKAVMNDKECNRFVKKLGVTVVSADYRLAPKHPYPAAIDDCYEAWLWFIENAERLGVDKNRIAIAGQSAGGGLAAALCQRIQDKGGVQPAVHGLFYPMIDDRTATREDMTEISHICWSNRSNFTGWSSYLGHDAGSTEETPPWAVPARRTDLTGQPPAWIGVGDKDLFYDEDLAYAARLEACGVPHELVIIEGAPHGFDALVPESDVSEAFRTSAEQFMAKHLGVEIR